ncbi:TonB-dependent siderophore receptor [Pseudomonas paralcaligenes]|uniref:TonB-dependent siderophore receptor n=1 Tax=Pseudomonas paralcaligenes TaxID=2772558 RepID=UPI001C7E6D5A|nr:TonB-dependent receptor [Pseudomonas paralcaligenes]
MSHPFNRHRLARHLQAALLGVGALTAATLQAAEPVSPAAVEDVRQYDIAAGPLAEVLGRFASAAGVALSFDAAQTGGRRSDGLRGAYSVDAGFARLLEGSGLRAIDAGGSYVLEKRVDSGDALELGATSISAGGLGSTTEGTGSYTTGSTSTATKLNLSLRETPQSVTVITRQRMDDQSMRSLDDVVQATPGLRMAAARPANSEYFSRGFPIGNLMFDGLPTTYHADWVAAADMAPYDRVEVVRGATGLMQGAGNPSAAINMIRKRPTQAFQGSLTGSVGSWDNYRGELDLSGPLGASDRVRGRFVGAYSDKDSFQDYAGRSRDLFYGITEIDLTDDTTLTLGASNQDDKNNINWGGLPVNPDGSHVGFSRAKTVGYDWSYQDVYNTTAFAELDQRFANDWRLHLGASKSWSDFKMTGAVLEHYATYQQRVFNQRRDYDQSTYDIYASGPFSLFDRTHELVLGASKREVETAANGSTLFIPVADIFDFDPSGLPKPDVPDSYSLSEHVEQEGAYLTTRLSVVDRLKIILGARLDWYDNTSVYNAISDGYYTDSDYKVTRNVTRYAGAIYDLDERHSVYASYTDIFMPQSETGRDRQIIRPIEGKNYELGIKGEYFGGALNASAALFQIDQQNRAAELDDQTGCVDFTCYGASGKVRAQGIDLELMGAITPDWQVGAGYTFSQTKYRKDANKAKEGRLFDTDLPRHLFKLNTVYTLPGELSRWRVGANLYGQSSIFNKGSNSTFGAYHIEQDAYLLVGLMAGFKVSEHLDTRLNVNNLFDKKYYQGIASNSTWSPYDVYGEPRNFVLSAKYSF